MKTLIRRILARYPITISWLVGNLAIITALAVIR